MKKSHYLSVLVVFAWLLSACQFSLAADVTPPPGYQPPPEMPAAPEVTSGPVYPLLPPDPLEGGAIFAEKCAPCHGLVGLGDGPQGAQLPNPVPALGSVEVARQAAPADWFNMVTRGNLERFMPPFTSLTDRQRWDVVAFALSLSVPASSIAQGETLYQANCAECHGENGRGGSAGVPDLITQETMAKKSAEALFQSISNGTSDRMPGFADKLSDDERWALADYLRSLTFASSAEAPAADLTPTTEVTASDGVTTTSPLSTTASLGSISGTVTNASGGLIPAGLAVNLHAFDGMQVVMTATTTTTDDGAYVFSDVELTEGYLFLTTIEFQGITYGSEVASFEPGSASLEMPLEIYETTTDPSVLVVDRLHFFFELTTEGAMRVVELYVISNPTAKTVMAAEEGEPVVTFSLPSGYSGLEFQDGEVGVRYLLTGEGFGDTQPVRPGVGSYQVMFSYEMPYNRKLELARPASMVTNAVVVLVPEDGLKISGASIQDAGVRDLEGVQYHLYNGSGVQPGQEVRLTISNNLRLLSSSSSSTNLLIGLAAVGVVLIGAGLWLYRRNQSAAGEAEEDDDLEAAPASSETPESLMDAILALDDLYQEGQLPEEAYIQRRAELRARLKELMG